MSLTRNAGMVLLACALCSTTLSSSNCANAQTRDEQIRQDKKDLADDDSWYYDDFEKATEVALQQKKPMMVVLRCIP